MYSPRLKEAYRERLAPALRAELGYRSLMEVPRVEKVVVNKGLGVAVSDKKRIDLGIEELGLITGQRPVVSRARKSISNFKLREGMPIGVRVTLRRDKMYEFLDRLVSVALPRVRDFQGIDPRSFDGRGNYTLGVREQIIFPEVSIDKVGGVSGMDITIVTTASTDKEALALLRAFGLPFKKN